MKDDLKRPTDRTDTGPNEARPTQKGSGPAHATVDTSAFGADSSFAHATAHAFDLADERVDSDGLTLTTADDERLGLTGTDRHPAEDWAADTGPTVTPDGERD